MSHGGTGHDSIELFNPSGTDAAVGGWLLTDNPAVPAKYRILDGTVIPAHGFLVLGEAQFNAPGSPTAFSLSSGGDEIYLFSAAADGHLTGYSHGFKFGAAAEGVSFGRYVVSTGDEDFPAQVSPTPGAGNSGPRVGPVVISEVHYHPAPGDPSFVELRNITAAPVSLFDADHPTNTWRLKGAGFDFPEGVVIAPGQRVLVADTDPASFRSRYGIAPELPVFGPYAGSLRNSGELLELQQPAPPTTNKLDFITVDFVRYNDRGGWPSAADGGGPSLQRMDDTAYGNDPANWVAALPSPGLAWAGGVRPTITQPPPSRVALSGARVEFQVSAASDAPLSYQWMFQGDALPGATLPALVLTNVQPAQAGAYTVVVSSDGGSIVSPRALLTVLTPARIMTQPANAFAVLGSNVTFTIFAVSTTPLTYQWRLNGADIPGATASTLAVKGVTALNTGTYTCVVTDGVGPVESQPALLTLVTKPVIVEPPIGIEVPQGGVAVFSAVGDGTTPLTFRWRKNGAVITNMILDRKTGVYTLTNVQALNAGRYSVVITNIAGTTLASPDAILAVVPDADGDGIPDAWETRYGLNPNDAADAMADPDKDGVNNRAEYLSGTDPKDALSYLRVDAIRAEAGGVFLEFMARSNHTYSVLQRGFADTAPWQLLASVPARGTNRVERVLDPVPSAAQRYYRLITPATLAP
jgi:hypothetical protein